MPDHDERVIDNYTANWLLQYFSWADYHLYSNPSLPLNLTVHRNGNQVQHYSVVSGGVLSPQNESSSTSTGSSDGHSRENEQRDSHVQVQDAMSYLDEVRRTFADKPHVYSSFLDIMKEFKTKAINTEGVIEKVSLLFNAHPRLIYGFNLFLPQGYRISEPNGHHSTGVTQNIQLRSPSLGVTSAVSPGNNSPTLANSVPHTYQLSLDQAQTPTVKHCVQVSKPVNDLIKFSNSSEKYSPNGNVSVASNRSPTLPSNNPVSLSGKPVEFNQAIDYVNKIKIRFFDQPEKYKKFLQILNMYQRTERDGDRRGKAITESEVYSRVSKLFENQPDLLEEFGKFLPDASRHNYAVSDDSNSEEKCNTDDSRPSNVKLEKALVDNAKAKNTSVTLSSKCDAHRSENSSVPVNNLKRPTNAVKATIPTKRSKVINNSKEADTAHKDGADSNQKDECKNETMYEFILKVRRTLNSPENFKNFIRCLKLFDEDDITISDLLKLVKPILHDYEGYFSRFKSLIRNHGKFTDKNKPNNNKSPPKEVDSDFHKNIDISTCKKLGASYIALPKNQPLPKCSGRTRLCHEVLNDTYILFPTWSTESTFVASRKNHYEDTLHRCEDERFELDNVIDLNQSAVKELENIQQKIWKLTPQAPDISNWTLEEILKEPFPAIYKVAISRIYGEKAPDILEGFYKKPYVALPIILQRLKEKAEEWREAKKKFNKIWHEQTEKCYLKSLDYQAGNFKQNDSKLIRSKNLILEINNLFEENNKSECSGEKSIGPHMILPYDDRCVLNDASDLLIHYAKRQSGIDAMHKRRIKYLLRQVIPDMFFHPRQELSEDEQDSEVEFSSTSSSDAEKAVSSESNLKEEFFSELFSGKDIPAKETCTIFYGNTHWYVFLRHHQILCERLSAIRKYAQELIAEEIKFSKFRSESTAIALRLMKENKIELKDYYPSFLDTVKEFLDGNISANEYEDTLRELFSIQAYICFTFDRLMHHAVRQLQHIVTDHQSKACIKLFLRYKENISSHSKMVSCNELYRYQAERILSKENCFKFTFFNTSGKLTIQMLHTEKNSKSVGDRDSSKENGNTSPPSDSCNGQDNDSNATDIRHFLRRNVRSYMRWAQLQAELRVKKKPSTESADNAENSGDRLGNEVNSAENTSCELSLKKFPSMCLLLGDGIYKVFCLTRARQSHKQVTVRKFKKFDKWHQRWRATNLTLEQNHACERWLLGYEEKTAADMRVMMNNDINLPPYRLVKSYRVVRNKF